MTEHIAAKPLSKHDLMSFIQSLTSNQEDKEPFYVLDMGVVNALFDTWTHNLPMVQPFYAVKCNPNLVFLQQLAELGAGFDCASRAEIETVLSLGVSPDRIIYANTCKSESHIRYAAKSGVNLATFDSKCELEKIKKWHPNCSLLIRIKVPESSCSKISFGSKFGTVPDEIVPLLQAAMAAELKVVGVSFHIGSGAINFHAFEEAIAAAKNTFTKAAQLGLSEMTILNVGGGFTSGPKFAEAATAVKIALEKHFPDESADGLTITAEPGRFFATEPFTLATNIIGKRERSGIKGYWINDGWWGSMNFLKYDHYYEAICSTILANRTTKVLPTYGSTVFGPTLDPGDKVLEGYKLPDLQVNDWLVFHNMGAYTSSCATDFNGFKTSAIATYLANSHKS